MGQVNSIFTKKMFGVPFGGRPKFLLADPRRGPQTCKNGCSIFIYIYINMENFAGVFQFIKLKICGRASR